MARSLIVASAGSGSSNRVTFLSNDQAMVDRLHSEGMQVVANEYGRADIRLLLTLFTWLPGKQKLPNLWPPKRMVALGGFLIEFTEMLLDGGRGRVLVVGA